MRSLSRCELTTSKDVSRGGANTGAASAQQREQRAFEDEFPGASWLSTRVVRALEEVGALAESMIAAVAQRHGLSHAALNALAVIEGRGAPMAVGEVSAHMHITSGTMTGVLDTLVRNGYVIRLSDPEDRRRVLVDITPAAQNVLNQLLPEIVHTTSMVLGDFEDKELHQLLKTMARLRSAIEAAPTELASLPTRQTPPHITR